MNTTATPVESVTTAALYEQGRQCALAITDDTDRMQVYRQSWRTRADPEAEGFRSVVMSGHEGAR